MSTSEKREGVSWPESTLTSEEERAVDEMSSFFPRAEYVMGERKLDFEYPLSAEVIFKAVEDKNGLAKLVVERDGAPVVDFSSFLPPGYQFVTPTNVLKNVRGLDAKLVGQFCEIPQFHRIMVGDMRDPKSIFSLLHEIGHSRKKLSPDEEDSLNNVAQLPDLTDRLAIEKIAPLLSKSERGAWGEGIRIAREIKRDTGIDLFGVFRDREEFLDFLYGAIITHRFNAEVNLANSRGLFSWTRELPREAMFGREPYQEERKFMEGLFDKGRLRRMSVRKKKEKENESHI